MEPPSFDTTVRLLLLGVFLLVSCPTGQTGRVLLVPVQAPSHVSYFSHLSQALMERGHEVYAVMNAECKKVNSVLTKVGVTILPYKPSTQDCYFEGRFKQSIFEEGSAAFLLDVSTELMADAEQMLRDVAYFQALRALDIDLAVVDGMGFTLFHYLVPYKLGVPHATLTTSFFGTWANIPALPSFTPYLYEPVSDRMTFMERVRNTINQIKGPIDLTNFAGSKDSLVSEYVPEKPYVSFLTLQRRSKLWLVNTDPVIDYPRVTLPHVIHVGGLTTGERKPLPEDLNKIVKLSKNIVVVSFGSMINHMPPNDSRKLMDAFRQVKEAIFIVKYNGPEVDDMPENVHLLPWLPQNDILGHPNVRLFITHCGNNGQFEALYHAVPMIGMPFFGDQFYGAKRMAVKGFGIAMKADDFTTESLVHNIREVLSNESYEIAIDRASQIFHDRAETAEERTGYWLDHIMKHGADHLISAGVEMPWYQFWLVDVMLLFLSMASVVLLALALLVWAIVRAVTITNTSVPKNKKKLS